MIAGGKLECHFYRLMHWVYLYTMLAASVGYDIGFALIMPFPFLFAEYHLEWSTPLWRWTEWWVQCFQVLLRQLISIFLTYQFAHLCRQAPKWHNCMLSCTWKENWKLLPCSGLNRGSFPMGFWYKGICSGVNPLGCSGLKSPLPPPHSSPSGNGIRAVVGFFSVFSKDDHESETHGRWR